jgi:hypothetical protein
LCFLRVIFDWSTELLPRSHAQSMEVSHSEMEDRMREVLALKSLQHANIVAFLGYNRRNVRDLALCGCVSELAYREN